jgi:CBS domain-containing protein
MKVKDVMSMSVACCTEDAPLTEVAKMMVACDCGAIPVADRDGRPLGVITDRDIVCRVVAQGRNPVHLRASEVMSAPAVTVTPDQPLADCCDVLEREQIRRVPVVDESGRCVGIVAQADIARHAPSREAATVVRRVSEPSVRASGIRD